LPINAANFPAKFSTLAPTIIFS
jgi:hypothetical protein